jgi:protein-S-isoprenylcysteine O-methyltransferase Ste14
LSLFYNWFFPALWVIFLLYWQLASQGAKSTERLEPLVSRLLRSLAFLLAIALLMGRWLPIPALYRFYLPEHEWTAWFWIGAAVNVLGLGFAVWARVYLGSNWSRSVTIKHDHELITGGLSGLGDRRRAGPWPGGLVPHLRCPVVQAAAGGAVDAAGVRRSLSAIRA